MGSVVLNGATSGSTTLTPTDAVTATLTLPNATSTLLASATAIATPISGTPSSSNFLRGDGTWNAPSAGAMTLISTLTANNTASSLSWTGLSGYDKYVLILENIIPNSNDYLAVQVGNSGGTLTSGYIWAKSGYSGSPSGSASGSTTFITIGDNAYRLDSTADGLSGSFTLTSFTSGYDFMLSGTCFANVATNAQSVFVNAGALVSNSTTKTSVTVLTQNSVNIKSGKASLYGISS